MWGRLSSSDPVLARSRPARANRSILADILRIPVIGASMSMELRLPRGRWCKTASATLSRVFGPHTPGPKTRCRNGFRAVRRTAALCHSL